MAEAQTTFGGPVALSFSGGGGRAAGFHLGVIAYLDRIDLLREVSILSSVSGGTFTAAKYALTLKTAPEGEDLHTTFQRFFSEYYEFLVTADLVPRAMTELTSGPPVTPSRWPTTVKALANVYDRTFLEGAKFGVFWGDREIHLQNIIFNSSECKDGDAFRFQKREPDVKIGSAGVWIETEHARHMRLADVVAASSDIPVGLEPLIFPDDFVWPPEMPHLYREIQRYLQVNFGIDSLPLADGGVIDNQGIEAVLLAAHKVDPIDPEHLRLTDEPRRLAESFYADIPFDDELGLYIVSDVPLVDPDIYHPKPRTPAKRSITLGGISRIICVLLLMAYASGVSLIGHALWRWWVTGLGWDAFFAYGVPLILAGSLVAALLSTRKWLRKVIHLASPVIPDVWSYLKKIRLDDLDHMIQVRLTSTWALTSSIFLARIRQLMYYALYSIRTPLRPGESRTENEMFASRLVPVDDYTLTREHARSSESRQPTQQMRQIARRCSHMSTTLWLTREQLDDLVVCGQMTTCFKLMQHLENMEERSEEMNRLLETLRKDWAHLKENPQGFLPERSPEE